MPEQPQENASLSSIHDLPTEICIYLFTFLPAKQFTKCREVCLKWKDIIDDMTRRDNIWLRHCKNDFKDSYKVARNNSKADLTWYTIYKSLKLWPKIAQATEAIDEFAPAASSGLELLNFSIFKNGIIGIHRMTCIDYFDVETFEKSKYEGVLDGGYFRYKETDDTVMVLNYKMKLVVVRKPPQSKLTTIHDNVKMFQVVDTKLFYVTHDNAVYLIDLADENHKKTFIKKIREEIICLGFTDQLYILTFEHNLYALNNNDMTLVKAFDESTTLLTTLRNYCMLENMYWRCFAEWYYEFHHFQPQGPLGELSVIKSYANLLFVGSTCGMLRIYNVENVTNLNLVELEPIKQYNFLQRRDSLILTDLCPIVNIDIIEGENKHIVLAALPKKIVTITYTHNTKRSASVAMLPYKEEDRIKLIRIDEAV